MEINGEQMLMKVGAQALEIDLLRLELQKAHEEMAQLKELRPDLPGVVDSPVKATRAAA